MVLSCKYSRTVKFLNFWTLDNFAVIYLKFKQRVNLRVFHQKDANEIANNADPDQIAPCSSRSSLIWVYTVCPDLFVPKLWIIMVIFFLNFWTPLKL